MNLPPLFMTVMCLTVLGHLTFPVQGRPVVAYSLHEMVKIRLSISLLRLSHLEVSDHY